MDQPTALTPLVCLNCATPIPAASDEAAWVCQQCGQGMALNPQEGLRPLQVQYLAGFAPNAVGKPYWVCQAQVRVQRETYKANRQSEQEALDFWNQPRRFFLPAYTLGLEDYLTAAINLLARPPALQPGPAVPFQPVTQWMEDIRPAVEFIITAIEAGRKDKLKKLHFEGQFDASSLWILP